MILSTDPLVKKIIEKNEPVTLSLYTCMQTIYIITICVHQALKTLNGICKSCSLIISSLIIYLPLELKEVAIQSDSVYVTEISSLAYVHVLISKLRVSFLMNYNPVSWISKTLSKNEFSHSIIDKSSHDNFQQNTWFL